MCNEIKISFLGKKNMFVFFAVYFFSKIMSVRGINNAIKKAYSDLTISSSFSSKSNVLKEAKKINKAVTAKDVENFLLDLPSYTQHKRVVSRFKTRKYIARGINFQWQADLLVLSGRHKKANKFSYILCVVDTFSRFMQGAPLKTKTNANVIKAFQKFFKNRGKPRFILTDSGSEFLGQSFQRFLKNEGIIHQISYNKWHSGMVERAIRTLKTRIFRFLSHNNTEVFISKLQQFIKNYNETAHSAFPNLSPSQITKDNESKIWSHLYSKIVRKAGVPSPRLKKGQLVRILKENNIFRKGYERNFTQEKFLINEIYPTNPVTYQLKSLTKGDIIQGSFYKEELSRTK